MTTRTHRSEDAGFFSLWLGRAIRTAEMTEDYFATGVGCSLRRVRMMLRSQALPGPELLIAICRFLDVDAAEPRRLIAVDRCRNRCRNAYWEAFGLNPEHDRFYVLWYFLTEEQRVYFTAQAVAIAES